MELYCCIRRSRVMLLLLQIYLILDYKVDASSQSENSSTSHEIQLQRNCSTSTQRYACSNQGHCHVTVCNNDTSRGNETSFSTEMECLASCVLTCGADLVYRCSEDTNRITTTPNQPGGKPSKSCPILYAVCNLELISWSRGCPRPLRPLGYHYYHNREEGRCKEFSFQDCQGNGNNFKTLEECEDICITPETTQPEAPPTSEAPPTTRTASYMETEIDTRTFDSQSGDGGDSASGDPETTEPEAPPGTTSEAPTTTDTRTFDSQSDGSDSGDNKGGGGGLDRYGFAILCIGLLLVVLIMIAFSFAAFIISKNGLEPYSLQIKNMAHSLDNKNSPERKFQYK